MKSLIRVAVLTLALISAGNASAVFAADAWEIVTPAGTSGYSFNAITAMNDYVYLGTDHGVYRSDNRGTTWSQIISGLGNQNVRTVAIGVIFDGSAYTINSGTPVFAATAGGVYKSTIGSTAWTDANNGLTSSNIKDIQFDQFLATQGIDTTVYVATPAGVFRSDDAGDNWLLVDTDMTGQSVTKIMTDFVTGNIYALTEANEIYVSPMFSVSGFNESWTLVYSGSDINDISLLNPIGGGVYWIVSDTEIVKSIVNEDGIISWSSVNSGNTSGRINVITSDYLDANVTYAGSQTGGVYRTINEALGNPAWAQISTSLADSVITDIATNPATSLLIYATGAAGVYRLELSDSDADVSTTPIVAQDTTAPTVPTNFLVIPVSSTQINLTWTASTDGVGVTGYRIERKSGSGTYSIIGTTSMTTYTDTTVSPLSTYTYRVAAYDAAANTSGNATSLSVTTLPTAPANLAASVVSTSQINLTWTASTEAVSGYELYRDNNLIATVAHPTTSYSDIGLAAGTTYTYTTKSVSTVGGIKSVFSNSVSAKTQSNVSSGGSSSGGGGGGGGGASTRGCTDPKATNYSAKAKKDNGTCKYTVVKSPTAVSNVVTNNSTSVSGYTFTVVMGLGSKGTDVLELQKIMISLGYLNETPTGYYGVMTEQAVKRFQMAKGLEVVGSVGPQTRAALNQITSKGSTVKTNDQIIQEKITQLLLLVQELTKKLMILKAAEGR